MRRFTLVLLLVLGTGWAPSWSRGDEEGAKQRPGLLSRRLRTASAPATPAKDATQEGPQRLERRPAGTFEAPAQLPLAVSEPIASVPVAPEKADSATTDSTPIDSNAIGTEPVDSVQEQSTEPPPLGRSTTNVERPVSATTTQADPLIDQQGRLHGTSITQRMDGIRRRAVDSDLSRSFVVEEPKGPYQVQQQNPLPRKSTPKVMPPVAPPVEAEVTPPVEIPETTPAEELMPAPTPAHGIPTPPPAPNHAQQDYYPRQEQVTTVPVDGEGSRDLLITNRSPSISFETAGPPAIVVGREATYRVVMINNGEMSGKNIVVSVRLPSWTEIISTSASVGTPQVDTATTDATAIQWEIAELAANGREELNLRLVPRDSRPFDLAVGWAFAPEATMAQIEVREPKLEMAVAGPDEILFGETDVYTITLNNPGSGDAENVVLNLLPLSTQHQMVGTRNLGTLRAGERKAIDVELTAHQAGKLQVKALAYADGNLRSEVVQEVTVRRPTLEVAVLGPPKTFASTPATYRIRVENTGDAAADDTTVLAVLPSGAQFLSSTSGGKVDAGRNHLSWSVGSLRPGAVRLLEAQINLQSPGDNRLDVQCTAARTQMVAKAIVTQVEALADLKLSVNDPQGAIPVGMDSTYEVRIVNRGTKAAENVQLTGFFSDGIEPISVKGWRGQPSTGQVAFAPIPSVAPGQEMVVRIVARAQQPGNHVFRAELTCAMPETRLAAEEWTKYYLAGPNSGETPILAESESASASDESTEQAERPLMLEQR